MTDYVAAATLKAYMGLTVTANDPQVAAAITSASREIDGHCRRRFYADAATSARVYRRSTEHTVAIDDAVVGTISLVEMDTGQDGTWAYTVNAGDWLAEPLNGVGANGMAWPVTRLRTLGSLTIPNDVTSHRPCVRVTARWGWPDIPEPVTQAALILAAETYKLREAPFGVAGFDQYGAVRIKSLPQVERLLAPFVLYESSIA